MKILCVSDEESRYYWDHYQPGCLAGIDLILAAGDLKAEYLEFLVTMGSAPLLYVPGNHDSRYELHPPEGCDCIDGKLVTVGGLRILGLGGSMLYNGGSNQYSEKQMARRIARLSWKIKRKDGADIILTHAPVEGYGDGDDPAHQGFACFRELIDRWHPAYFVHGHIHKSYGIAREQIFRHGETVIINACGYYLLEV